MPPAGGLRRSDKRGCCSIIAGIIRLDESLREAAPRCDKSDKKKPFDYAHCCFLSGLILFISISLCRSRNTKAAVK
jgi:hypothetical protein